MLTPAGVSTKTLTKTFGPQQPKILGSIALIVFTLLCVPLWGEAAPVTDKEDATIHAKSHLKNSCPKCKMEKLHERVLPFSGSVAWRIRALNEETGEPHRFYLSETGEVVSRAKLDEDEARARFEAIGRMNIGLANHVASMEAGGVASVYVVSPISLPKHDRERIQGGDTAYLAEVEKDYDERIVAAQQELVDRLSDLGYTPDGFVPSFPAVRVIVSKQDILKLAWSSAPIVLFRDLGPGIPTSAKWLYATELDQPHDWFYTGDGVKLAVLLSERPYGDLYDGVPESPGVGDPIDIEDIRDGSATTVGTNPYAMLASVKTSNGRLDTAMGRDQGAAPDALLYMADGDDTQGNVEDWARGKDALVYVYGRGATSAAAGNGSFHDFVVDYKTRELPCLTTGCMHYVGSAGNRNAQGEPSYDSCSPTSGDYVQNKFYNGLVVGGSSTGTTNDWRDDYVYTCSSWQNKSNTDWELPSLVAPATGVDTGGLRSEEGTSLAASIVGGLIAILLEKNTYLRFYPEAVRAILMATAWKDVDGYDFDPEDSWDDKDGAGLVSASRATHLAGEPEGVSNARGWWSDDVLFSSDFDANGKFYRTFTVTLRAGYSLRASAHWQATSAWIWPPFVFGTLPDLDIELCACRAWGAGCYPYSNTTVCTSADDSNYELLQLANPSSTYDRTYRIFLYGSDFNSYASGETRLGIAWDTLGDYFYEDVCDTTDSHAAEELYFEESSSQSYFLEQFAPDIAALKNGEYAVAWSSADDATSANKSSIKIEIMSKDGVIKTVGHDSGTGVFPVEPIKVAKPTTTTYYNMNPRLGVRAHDQYTLVWDTHANSTYSYAYRQNWEKYEGGAASKLDTERAISPDVSDEMLDSDESLGCEDSYQWYTWLRTSGESRGEIQANDFGAGSLLIGDADPATLYTAERHVLPTVAAFPDDSAYEGGAVFAYIDEPATTANSGTYTPASGTIKARCVSIGSSCTAQPGAVFAVDSDAGQVARHPAIGMFDDGSFVIAWVDYGDNARVKYRLYEVDVDNDTCSAPGSVQTLCDDSASDPYLYCSSGASRLWEEESHGRLGIATGRVEVSGVSKKAFRIGYVTDSFYGRDQRRWAVTRLVHVADNLTNPVLASQDILRQGSSSVSLLNIGNVAVTMDPDCNSDYFSVWPECPGDPIECGPTVPMNFSLFEEDSGISGRLRPWPLP